MAGWLDKAAKVVAGRSARQEPAAPAAAADSGISRRDALKRAGVVGAVVWTAPLVESVLAPSFAMASPGTTTCTGASDLTHKCGGTGGCPKCYAGKTCTADSDCVSNECTKAKGATSGTCAKSNAGEGCESGSDCLSGKCQSDGTCAKSTVSSGSCQTDADCTTNKCQVSTGTCQKVGQGKPCAEGPDCISGTCNSGTCA